MKPLRNISLIRNIEPSLLAFRLQAERGIKPGRTCPSRVGPCAFPFAFGFPLRLGFACAGPGLSKRRQRACRELQSGHTQTSNNQPEMSTANHVINKLAICKLSNHLLNNGDINLQIELVPRPLHHVHVFECELRAALAVPQCSSAADELRHQIPRGSHLEEDPAVPGPWQIN